MLVDTLCDLITQDSLVDKQGFMDKAAVVKYRQVTPSGVLRNLGFNKSKFERRWFVLRDNCIFYYADKGQGEALGVFPLECCSVGVKEDSIQVSSLSCVSLMSQSEYLFEIAAPSMRMLLRAASATEMASWVDAIQTCISRAEASVSVSRNVRLRQIFSLGQVRATAVAESAPAAPTSSVSEEELCELVQSLPQYQGYCMRWSSTEQRMKRKFFTFIRGILMEFDDQRDAPFSPRAVLVVDAAAEVLSR